MRIITILAFLLLSACVVEPQPVAPADSSQATEKETDTRLRDTIQEPIEKAKKVEDQVIDGAEKQKADIEAAGG